MERKAPPKVVSNYASDIEKRNQQRLAEKRANPQMPNLAQAAVSYDPKNGEKTLSQIGEEQRSAEAHGTTQDKGALSSETIGGLKAIFEANKTQQPVRVEEAKPVPVASEPEDDLDLETEFADTGVDAEVLSMLRSARAAREKLEAQKAEVEKRLKPIAIEDGLATGEWRQLVPIVPGVLEVTFKTLTQQELYQARRHARLHLGKEPELDEVKDDLLGFYQTVCSVVQIGKTRYEPHMVNGVFAPDAFEKKITIFLNFPYQLIGQLGLHGQWFDERVRKLFDSTEAIKNG